MDSGRQRIKILLVESNSDSMVLFDPLIREINALNGNPYEFIIIPAMTLTEAKNSLETNIVDAIIVSLSLSQCADVDFFSAVKYSFNPHAMIIMSEEGSPACALDAAKAGIHDFIWKKDLNALRLFQAVLFAVEKKKQSSRVNESVLLDPLTGAYNKKGLLKVTLHAQGSAIRKDQGFSILYIDYDRFRIVNETAGTSAGDETLKAIANILLTNFRSSDYIARVGEDEFVVFTAGSASWVKEAFLLRMERILSGKIQVQGLPIGMTLSYGFVHQKADDFTGLENLIAEGQKAMFEHRRKRRDASKNETVSVMNS
jgi:diguanylate cyclase (GGDEF)-like protein